MTPTRTGSLLDRARALHRRGMAANEQMRPTVAARHLYAALDLLDQLSQLSQVTDRGPNEAELLDLVGSARAIDRARPTNPSRSAETGEALVAARALRGRIRISLAWAESERGNVTAGLQLLADAEHDLPPTEIGLVHGQRGILLRRTGRDAEAAVAYGRALASFDPETQPDQLARVRLNRSMMHLAAVDLAAARADLEVCLELAEQHDLPHLSAKAKHNLGLLDFVAGDLPRALTAYREAESTYGSQAPGMIAQLGLDRARALVAAGLLTEAEAELRQAVRRLAGQRLEQDLAEAHLALAEVALLAERPGDVIAHARRAAQILRRRRNDRWLARARLLELRGALTAGRAVPPPEQFRSLAADCTSVGLAEEARMAGILAARAGTRAGVPSMPAAALRPRADDRLDTRLLWALSRAEAQLADGEGPAARRSLAHGLAALDVQRSRMGAIDLRSGAAVHGRVLARLGLESAVREGRPSTIFHWSELSRAQALRLPPVRPPMDPELAALLAELRALDATILSRQNSALESGQHPSRSQRSGARSGRGSPAAQGLAELRRRREVLRGRVREQHWSLAPGSALADGPGIGGRPGVGGGPAIVRLGKVREELRDAALVSYLNLRGRLAALVVTARRAVVVPLGTIDDIAEPLQRLRIDLDVAAGRRLPAPIAASVRASTTRHGAMLSAQLIDPLLPTVGDADLVLVPTGPLLTVPWATLPPLRGRPVTVALSATNWAAGQGRLADLLTFVQGGPVLVAHGPRIEYGNQEVTDVARRFPGAQVLTGASATVEQVLTGLGEARLAHLASHGHHADDNALFSGLEFADGTVMGYDVQRQPAVPALVVLSACDVGRSTVAPGDESLGMVSAFAAAGSSTVIAAVCRIADELAPSVMRAFYDGLEAGHGPARALAEAGSREGVTGLVCFGSG